MLLALDSIGLNHVVPKIMAEPQVPNFLLSTDLHIFWSCYGRIRPQKTAEKKKAS